MPNIQFCLLVVASILSRKLNYVLAKDVCYTTPIYEYYCDDGYHCCQGNTKCCLISFSSDSTLSSGAIAGIVIGGIIFIICTCAVISSVAKKCHRPGQVIHPGQPSGVAIISTGQQHRQPSYGQPQYGFHQTQGSSDYAYPPLPGAY